MKRFSYTLKRGGGIIPRPFPKKTNLSIFLDQWSKILFLLYAKFRTIELY